MQNAVINHGTQPLPRPKNPCFSSGPCVKRPGYNVNALNTALLGRSHRSKEGKALLQYVGKLTAELLGVPDDYRIGMIAGSDTGAIEAALWSMLGARPVDVLAWEAFGKDWVNDIVNELKIPETRTLTAPYGALPDLTAVNFAHDVVFTGNGTTSGVMIPDEAWIPDDRAGLTVCDATSLIFARPIAWHKLDVITFSWQKAVGGEGAHGMLMLSPRAAERLQAYVPKRPIPKIFKLAKDGKIAEGIFNGEPINTPSMLCVADYCDALEWIKSIGGIEEFYRRTANNAQCLYRHIDSGKIFTPLPVDARTRSLTSVCFNIVEPRFQALSAENQSKVCKAVVTWLDRQGVAYDIGAYRDAPPGLRVWCGGMAETADVQALCPWLDRAVLQALDEVAELRR